MAEVQSSQHSTVSMSPAPPETSSSTKITVKLEKSLSNGVEFEQGVTDQQLNDDSPVKLEAKEKAEVKQETIGAEVESERNENGDVKVEEEDRKPKLENGDTDDVDMTREEDVVIVQDEKEIARAKERHQADLKHHHYEPPQAERVQDEYVGL